MRRAWRKGPRDVRLHGRGTREGPSRAACATIISCRGQSIESFFTRVQNHMAQEGSLLCEGDTSIEIDALQRTR